MPAFGTAILTAAVIALSFACALPTSACPLERREAAAAQLRPNETRYMMAQTNRTKSDSPTHSESAWAQIQGIRALERMP
jgi:hypothetical protein